MFVLSSWIVCAVRSTLVVACLAQTTPVVAQPQFNITPKEIKVREGPHDIAVKVAISESILIGLSNFEADENLPGRPKAIVRITVSNLISAASPARIINRPGKPPVSVGAVLVGKDVDNWWVQFGTLQQRLLSASPIRTTKRMQCYIIAPRTSWNCLGLEPLKKGETAYLEFEVVTNTVGCPADTTGVFAHAAGLPELPGLLANNDDAAYVEVVGPCEQG